MFQKKILILLLIVVCVAFMSLVTPTTAEGSQRALLEQQNLETHIRTKRWTCNDITGDFLCAGWPGSWRCQCGAACYSGVCTCKRCI